MAFRLAALTVTFAILGGYWSRNQETLCRCRPGDDCWPSKATWDQLNETIGGNLAQLRPVGAVCHEADYIESACNDLIQNYRNTTWRVENPGRFQQTLGNIGERKSKVVTLKIPPESSQCHQGRVSHYSAYVQSVAEVQHVVRFAASHRLRITIRNTGHDLAGRSSAPNSLQIHTAGLKGIHHMDSFTPHAPVGQSVIPEGPAVRVGAGVLTVDLYSAAADGGFTVVGGSCSTVGIAGGWIQGGGYGILTPSRGLGVDNLLEVGVVTAEGEYVIANQYQNHDLFWAIRGGGGGTFGVIVDVTMRTYPDTPIVVSKMNIISPDGADNVFWNAVTDLLHTIPMLVDRGDAVQAFAMPILPDNAAFLTIESYLINNTHPGGQEALDDLRDRIEAHGLSVQSSEESFDRISSYLALPKGLEQAGIGMMAASRLISRDLMVSDDGPSHISQTLAKLTFSPGDVVSLEGMVGGPAVQRSGAEKRATHPSWQSAWMSLSLGRGLPSVPDWATYNRVQHELATTQLPALEALEHGMMGGYLGTPFPYEAHPSKVFWGSNYDRLLDVKAEWDPEDLFMTRMGIGSERWDDEGICQVNLLDRHLWPYLQHVQVRLFSFLDHIHDSI
ncbi:FAD-binding type 2 [Penicillium malachiteum]|uniref:FAD-binding type 2 n=1 Tax=Penicillium malachiteum TaxID=1324776 RepID=UPI0025471A42|nr:FAD-binding type 2 [Penicillium malachiteum]KAJ5720244.1 FAD-binding type 2 [Penicillium malachiteum]